MNYIKHLTFPLLCALLLIASACDDKSTDPTPPPVQPKCRTTGLSLDASGAGVSVKVNFTFEYNGDGLPYLSFNNLGNKSSFTYEKRLLKKSTATSLNGPTISTEYKYDQLGRLLSTVMTNGTQTVTFTYIYDGQWRISKVMGSNNTSTEYSYDQAGNMTQKIETSSTGNKFVTNYSDFDDKHNYYASLKHAFVTNPETSNPNNYRKRETSSGEVFTFEYTYNAEGFPSSSISRDEVRNSTTTTTYNYMGCK